MNEVDLFVFVLCDAFRRFSFYIYTKFLCDSKKGEYRGIFICFLWCVLWGLFVPHFIVRVRDSYSSGPFLDSAIIGLGLGLIWWLHFVNLKMMIVLKTCSDQFSDREAASMFRTVYRVTCGWVHGATNMLFKTVFLNFSPLHEEPQVCLGTRPQDL